MKQALKEKLKQAYSTDPDLVCERSKVAETLGNDSRYLEEILKITKSDLIRLERKNLALKARYETKDGVHRVRWIIFKEAVE